MRIFFVVDNRWKCTLLTSFLDASVINLSFGLDIGCLVSAENEYNNEQREIFLSPFFDKVISIIDYYINKETFKESFIAASIGIEYSVQFHDDLMAMLTDNNGAIKWILPRISGEQIVLKNFLKEEKSNSFVFTFFEEIFVDVIDE